MSLCNEGRSADIMIANNVLAHVPDINDFVSGFTQLLKPDGVATFEFPHLLQLVQNHQFDTSTTSTTLISHWPQSQMFFATNGLSIFDVEHLITHGGSLRVFAQRLDAGSRDRTKNVDETLQQEKAAGIQDISFYLGFQAIAERIKNDFLQYLIRAKQDGKRIAAYGPLQRETHF